jgi:hydrogenase expression/formation protein HypC
MCLGIPGQIIKITDVQKQMALVDVSGVQREVSLECVVDDYYPLEKCVGHWVLVHVGFAMSLINEQEAEATLKVLRELGEVQAELQAMRESAASPTANVSATTLPALAAQTS